MPVKAKTPFDTVPLHAKLFFLAYIASDQRLTGLFTKPELWVDSASYTVRNSPQGYVLIQDVNAGRKRLLNENLIRAQDELFQALASVNNYTENLKLETERVAYMLTNNDPAASIHQATVNDMEQRMQVAAKRAEALEEDIARWRAEVAAMPRPHAYRVPKHKVESAIDISVDCEFEEA